MIKVAIIGTGNIGHDLMLKLHLQKNIHIVAFVGRRPQSKQYPDNIVYSDKSLQYFIENPNCCDIVFDCTDAYSAVINYNVFLEQNLYVIDLTPSQIGNFYVPYLTPITSKNINMITCGAQSCLPILKYLSMHCSDIKYAEVVTQISASSAGIATRNNIDKYIETTQDAIADIANIQNSKVILNLNPGKNINMKTTIFLETTDIDLIDFETILSQIRTYIPEYVITTPSWKSPGILMIQISIMGNSNIISKYHGNLDIINCTALHACNYIIKKYLDITN